MQNRLRQLKETREGHQTQQMELRAQIEAEKAARVDNVGVFLGEPDGGVEGLVGKSHGAVGDAEPAEEDARQAA